MVQAARASPRYLPPYSPDLNSSSRCLPIQSTAAHKTARTKEGLSTTIGELLDHFPAEECQNYLTECEYESVELENVSKDNYAAHVPWIVKG